MKKLVSILKLNKKGVITSIENIYGVQTLTDVELSSVNGGAMQINRPSAMNAKLLALQTRQNLGVQALSMASQSASSVLRLFQ